MWKKKKNENIQFQQDAYTFAAWSPNNNKVAEEEGEEEDELHHQQANISAWPPNHLTSYMRWLKR